jgi:hypothetical protein
MATDVGKIFNFFEGNKVKTWILCKYFLQLSV